MQGHAMLEYIWYSIYVVLSKKVIAIHLDALHKFGSSNSRDSEQWIYMLHATLSFVQ